MSNVRWCDIYIHYNVPYVIYRPKCYQCRLLDFIWWYVRLEQDKPTTVMDKIQEGRKEMFYLTTHSTHFISGYMASDIWKRTIQIAREETRCRHMSYSFRLKTRVLLYALSHRQDNTYHGLCYASRGGSIRRPIAP